MSAYIQGAFAGSGSIAPAPTYIAPAIDPLPDIDGDPSAGALVFQLSCIACHGDKGQGRFGVPLAKSWSGNQPEVYIRSVASNGIRGTTMPAWAQVNGGPLSDEDIANVAAFILTLSPVSTSPQPPPLPTEGPISANTVLLFVAGMVILGIVIGVVYYRRAREAGKANSMSTGSSPLKELDLTPEQQLTGRSMLRFARLRLAMGAVLLLLVLGSAPVTAQTTTAPIDHLEVALWPEYDRPAMLVIYRFELAADTPLPARVALPVPAAVGQPHAVAWVGSDDVLYDAAFTSESAGDWLIVQIDMPEALSGQLEYYADMDFAGTIRSFLFEWPIGFELGGLSYEVQEPTAATDLRVNPAPDREGPGAFSLNYLTAELGPQPADGALAISVTYAKSDPVLSVEALQPLGQVAIPIEVQAQNPNNFLPWLLLAAGVAILGAGGYYFASRRRLAPQQAPSRRRKRGTDVELEASTVYCHQCGAAAGISDVYCRQCGTQLRK